MSTPPAPPVRPRRAPGRRRSRPERENGGIGCRPVPEPDIALRHSPLDAEHRTLGARMAPFGGWDMPIQFSSVLEEHRACRDHAVALDVSHLGSVRVAGARGYEPLGGACRKRPGTL